MQHAATRGRVLNYQRPEPDPHRALLACVVLTAIRDAQRGDGDAAAWLACQDIPEQIWRNSKPRMDRR